MQAGARATSLLGQAYLSVADAYLFMKHSDEWHMGTDDSGYELAVCHQLGKAAKLRTGTRFSTDLSTDLSTVFEIVETGRIMNNWQ